MPDSKKDKSTGLYSKEELEALKNVNRRLELLVDYKHQFKSGILRGIGFAIGASIIGAILVTIILNIVQRIDSPFIQDLINNAESTTHSEIEQLNE